MTFAHPMLFLFTLWTGDEAGSLPNTQSLAPHPDRSAAMVTGISQFLDLQTEKVRVSRAESWRRDFLAKSSYEQTVAKHRPELARNVGVLDRRCEPRLLVADLPSIANKGNGSALAENVRFTVHRVQWDVLNGVTAEGLLLEPVGEVKANVIATPDANQTPELISGLTPGLRVQEQFARRLASVGCRVLVPTIIDRQSQHSGNPRIGRQTKQPHREWIHRQAFELGRHLIGYEIQKILAGVDWFTTLSASKASTPIFAIGYGEGGLLTLISTALDPRISGAYVGGSYGERERLFAEPIDRNRFNLLSRFGDAELACMIFPRPLWVDATRLEGPYRAAWQSVLGETPGEIQTPRQDSFLREVDRARSFAAQSPPTFPVKFGTVTTLGDKAAAQSEVCPGLAAWCQRIGMPHQFDDQATHKKLPTEKPGEPALRQARQIREVVAHVQSLIPECENYRRDFWRSLEPEKIGAAGWSAACGDKRRVLRQQIIGEFSDPKLPLRPRTRLLYETNSLQVHEVVLDVFPHVFAWGWLLVPTDIEPNERRPVVVCQHGLEGVPEDTAITDPQHPAFAVYKGFATQLAERGFVVFAPHNPYRGGDAFRVLQRKANPIGRTLFSVIVAQHEAITQWIADLPFVDPTRIGFYGLSYGGKTAMRVPALVDRYCLSICSADFNDWVKKNATVEDSHSYMFTGEYEIFEWNLGPTFNYAEMAALIAPRPFMVERGHADGVARDEWVAFEYAKVRRLYTMLGVADRTRIEFFDGPHQIHGVGTFEFLHQHLKFPVRTKK